jgi:uncharacterized protein YbaA (DUF1428 family)
MYVSGFITPVPEGNKEAYRKMADEAAEMFKANGALESVECWEDDVQDGKQTDFRRAVAAQDGEKIVFSWLVWPDKETANACYQKMMDEGMMNPADMPFDGMRMVWGGFSPIVSMGRDWQ